MTHVLTGADRATHCKILALAAVLALTMISLTARVTAVDAAAVQAQATALAIGKLGIVAALEPATVR
jgi:hypothetical protein